MLELTSLGKRNWAVPLVPRVKRNPNPARLPSMDARSLIETFLSPSEISDQFSFPVKKLYRLLSKNQVLHYRYGTASHIRINPKDFEKYLAKVNKKL